MQNHFMLNLPASRKKPRLRIPRAGSGSISRVRQLEVYPFHDNYSCVVIANTDVGSSKIVVLYNGSTYSLPEHRTEKFNESSNLSETKKAVEEMCSIRMPALEHLYHQPERGTSQTAYLSRSYSGNLREGMVQFPRMHCHLFEVVLTTEICDRFFVAHQGPLAAALRKLRDDPTFFAANQTLFRKLDARRC